MSFFPLFYDIATAAKHKTILDAVFFFVSFFINQLTRSIASLHHISYTYYIEIVKVCKVIKTGLHTFICWLFYLCLFATTNIVFNVVDETDCCWGQLSFYYCMKWHCLVLFREMASSHASSLQCHCSLLAIIFYNPIQDIIYINRQVL